MKIQAVCLKRYLVFLYIIAPIFFYGPAFLLSLESGEIRMHFFRTFDIPSQHFMYFLIGHILLGAGLMFALRKTNFTIYLIRCRSFAMSIFALMLFAIYVFLPLGYFKILALPMMMIVFSRYRFSSSVYLIMLFMALLKTVFFYDRFPVVLILMVWSMPYVANKKFHELVVLAILAFLFLVFVLQPVRSGNFNLDAGLQGIEYSVKHVFPIFVGAHISLSMEPSVLEMVLETVPGAKGILGEQSIIEKIARIGLPDDIIRGGTRHGSNSSMYFSIFGAIILLLVLLVIKSTIGIFKVVVFRNSVLLFFLLYGPYFVRRSFGSFFVDFVFLFFVSIALAFVLQILRSRDNYATNVSGEGLNNR